jgi:hypothetical protein
MDTGLVRQFWSAVESFPSHRLASLDDSNLVRSLLDWLQNDPAFDPRNVPAISLYIQTRMPLIREMADSI